MFFVTHVLNWLLGKKKKFPNGFVPVVPLYFEIGFGEVRVHDSSERCLYIFIDVRNLTNIT